MTPETINPPVRLKIMQAICDLFKTIHPDNGFQMDLRDEEGGIERVRRGVLFIGDDDPDFLVTVLDPPTAVEALRNAPDNPNRVNEWDILVQGWAKDLPVFQKCDLAHVLAADVTKVLGTEIKKTRTGRPGATNILGMGNTIIKMRIGAPVVRPTEQVTDFGTFYLILTLEIVEDMANPLG